MNQLIPINHTEGYLFASGNEIPMKVYEDPVVQTSILIMFCDIYINGNYFKTLSTTSWHLESQYSPTYGINGNASVWQFDISRTVEEWFEVNKPNSHDTLIATTPAIVSVMCKYRGGEYDANGILQVSGTAPIQATYHTGPQSGTGVQSGIITILHAAVEHDYTRDLLARLEAYKVIGYAAIYNALPLTTTTVHYACKSSKFTLPFVFPWRSMNGANQPIDFRMFIAGKYKNGSLFYALNNIINVISSPSVFNIQAGISVLKTLTWDAVITWDDIESYCIGMQDDQGGDDQFASHNIYLKKCCDATRQIVFLNKLGGYEPAFFDAISVVRKNNSSQWKKRAKYYSVATEALQKREYGSVRYNVASNDFIKLRSDWYGEELQEWITTLLDSPCVYQLLPASYGKSERFVPAIINDGEWQTYKENDRYEYVTEIILEQSNENKSMRL